MVIDMKRFLVLCVMAAIFTGCRQESVFCEPEASRPVFRAVTEPFSSGITRTTLGADFSSLWSEGDKVAIFAGSSQKDQYILDSRCTGSSNGVFNLLLAGEGGGASVPANIAIYPYQENLICLADGTGYKFSGFSYPSLQNYCIESFDQGAYAMAAITSSAQDFDLGFRNIGGAIKLQLVGKDVLSKITVRGKEGEKLSGKAEIKVFADGSSPAVEMDDTAEDFVALNCGDGVQLSLSVPVNFYIAVPPVAFYNGFTVELENSNGEICTLETSAENIVGRSQILAMPIAKAEFDIPVTAPGDYVDEYGINWGQGVIINGVRWAPVNCGFKEESVGDKGFPYGKTYQWGRLHGVGFNTTYDSSVADKVAGGSITIAEANAGAANVFYTVTTSNSHWFTDTSIENVWNAGTSASPAKSANDPCPDGWRLPTQSEMKALVANRSGFVENSGQMGYWFSGSKAYNENVPALFLPAAGSLGNNGSISLKRESYGRYWTSTVRTSDNLVYGLNFAYNSSNFNVVLTGGVYGYSVRCVAVE